jgi:hypothetical protein
MEDFERCTTSSLFSNFLTKLLQIDQTMICRALAVTSTALSWSWRFGVLPTIFAIDAQREPESSGRNQNIEVIFHLPLLHPELAFMHLTKRRKARIAKFVAVASAALVLLTLVIKEIIKDELKELHDSLANAESQFRLENGQSTIQFQLLAAQEELENAKLPADKERGKKTEDYSTLIAKDTATPRQALAHMNADFESVSRLIDAFRLA